MLTTCSDARSFEGPGALTFLSHLLPSSLSSLPLPGEDAHRPFGSTLSVLLNEEGGIIDDCMITRWGEQSCVPPPLPASSSRRPERADAGRCRFYLVTNAGRSDVDIPWIKEHVEEWNAAHEDKVHFKLMPDNALVALQGASLSSSFSSGVSHSHD